MTSMPIQKSSNPSERENLYVYNNRMRLKLSCLVEIIFTRGQIDHFVSTLSS